MRRELELLGCEGIEVASAGTWAGTGSPATRDAVEVVAAYGANLESHSSRSIEAHEIAAADLIVAMTNVHVLELLELAPHAEPKILLVKQLREAEVEPPPGATPNERLAALLAHPKPSWRRAHDLDDPMGLPASAYERAARELNEGVRKLARVLCG